MTFLITQTRWRCVAVLYMNALCLHVMHPFSLEDDVVIPH